MTAAPKVKYHPSSFRDPSGFVFSSEGAFYRQVNKSYQTNYEHFVSSGLSEELQKAMFLVPYVELDNPSSFGLDGYKVLKAETVPFISYPYEWCFQQLKDAAVLMLKVQKTALEFGMTLKDSSAYNIQFFNGRPILIDLLSFEKYEEGAPWGAYKQFCQHFLAPLCLMAYADLRLVQLMRIYIDGIPLDLTTKLLPFTSLFKPSIFLHVYLHGKSQRHLSEITKEKNKTKRSMSKAGMLGLLDSLEFAIKNIRHDPKKSIWSDYYSETNYSEKAFQGKKVIVEEYLEKIDPENVWDFGANEGVFSRVASRKCNFVASFEMDYEAVEKNYKRCVASNESKILPLVLDLTNPSPAQGWAGEERQSIFERGNADVALALALIHHLTIANNTPFRSVASFFSRVCKNLIIEFVPKDDSQVQRLLRTREDVFSYYNQQSFEDAFEEFFSIADSKRVQESNRYIYLMQKR